MYSEFIKKLRDKADVFENNEYPMEAIVQDYRNCAKVIEYLAEKQQQKTDWIPCEERLPEPAKRYLVSAIWIDGDYVSKPTVYDAVFGTDGKWHTDDYKEVPYEVIAWQPLPQSYREDKQCVK